MILLMQVLNRIPLAIGIGAILIGAGAAIFPERSSKAFGVKADSGAQPYVRVTGARDIFIGLVFIYLYWQGDRLGMGLTCLFTALVGGVDFITTRVYGSRIHSLAHLGATVAVTLYGIWLLKS